MEILNTYWTQQFLIYVIEFHLFYGIIWFTPDEKKAKILFVFIMRAIKATSYSTSLLKEIMGDILEFHFSDSHCGTVMKNVISAQLFVLNLTQ